MTAQQIETAARDFCRRIGVDPDELVALPASRGIQLEPRWKEFIRKVREEYERQAMKGAVCVAMAKDPIPLSDLS